MSDFDKLVADILENPERILDPSLDDDTVLAIQRQINPYARVAGPPPPPDRKRVIAASYTNLRENYLRRLSMTSLVGFLYQVLSEWDAPADVRRWHPEAAKRAAAAVQPFAAAELADMLEAAAAVARDAATTAAPVADLRRAAADAALGAVEGASPADAAALEHRADEAEARAAGLLYAATHMASAAGEAAKARLRVTAEAGMKYPSVREVIAEHPLPPVPGALEVPVAVAKKIAKGFLDKYLCFDPSEHVRSGHDAKAIAGSLAKAPAADGASLVSVDRADPGHLTMEALGSPPPSTRPDHQKTLDKIVATAGGKSAVVALLRDAELAEAATAALADPAAFREYLMPVGPGEAARPAVDHVPPQDTFHRWAYYTEVNYEALRTVTEAIYPDRPDLDWAIAVWETFEGTPAEVDADFSKFCQKHQNDVPSAIKSLEFGAWSLLADFGENRKKIEFYNANTEVLKRILDRHAEDAKIGSELMRNRVRHEKAKNIAEVGPDAPGLASYKRAAGGTGRDPSSLGAEKVISAVEMKYLERANGDIKAAKELEVLEQYRTTIETLTAAKAVRALTDEEARDLDFAQSHIGRALEMAAVPENAIQVDVFTNDTRAGTFGKSHIYTEAVAPDPDAVAAASSAGTRPRFG